MAINRGPWNALVDDDGSNLVGSIWNKAAIKTVILDPVDAALPVVPASAVWQPAPLASGIADVNGTALAHTIISSRQIRIGPTTVIWQFQCDSVAVVAPTSNLYLSTPGFTCPHAGQKNPVTYSTLAMYVYPEVTAPYRFLVRKNDFTNIAVASYYFGFTAIWEVNP